MSDLLTVITVLGVPANVAAVVSAFWLIDRRLVRIETALSLRERRDPFEAHAKAMELRL